MSCRKRVTVQSRRQGLNAMCVVFVVVAVVLYMFIPRAVGFLARWVEFPSNMIKLVHVGIIVLAVVSVGVVLLMRPKKLVKAQSGDDRVYRRFVGRTRRRWVKAATQAGLTRTEPLDDDHDTLECPAVDITPHPLGARMLVHVVPGTSAKALGENLDGLKSALRVELRSGEVNATSVEMFAVLRDPLEGMQEVRDREAVDMSSGYLSVGRREDGETVGIDVFDAAHIGIQGMTRAGKSALTMGLIAQAVDLSGVRIGGIDPNKVLLQPLADSLEDHDRFVLGSEPAEAAALLERYVSIMDARLEDLVNLGVDQLGPEHFVHGRPVELLILEEYPAMKRAADLVDKQQTDRKVPKLGPKIQGLVGRLLSEGAKVGIRVLIIAQRADAEILGGAERAQLGQKITLRVDNGDAVRMFHPMLSSDVVDQVSKFSPGRGIFQYGGEIGIIQADFCSYPTYRDRLGLEPAPVPEELEEVTA